MNPTNFIGFLCSCLLHPKRLAILPNTKAITTTCSQLVLKGTDRSKMAEDPTTKELEAWADRCTEYSKRTGSVGDAENRIERLGDVDSDWKAWVSPVYKGIITFDTISARYQESKNAWLQSAWYQASYKAIEETVFAQANLNITTCMCLGLGSFTGIHGKRETDWRDRALSQLVAFECWVDQLSG